MINGLGSERLPAVDLAHVDLAGGEQRPEQHGGSVSRWQNGLRLDPSLELLVQPLDGVGGPNAAPLTWRQTGEGDWLVALFFKHRRKDAADELGAFFQVGVRSVI